MYFIKKSKKITTLLEEEFSVKVVLNPITSEYLFLITGSSGRSFTTKKLVIDGVNFELPKN